MGPLGLPEILLIAVVVLLLVLMPERLGKMGRALGQSVREVRKGVNELPLPDLGSMTSSGEQPLVVFVSSVIGELAEERRMAQEVLEQLPFSMPWVFEFTPPSTEVVDEAYLRKVRACDVFILIVGQSVTDPVRREYEVARAAEKPCLVFLKDCEREAETQAFVRDIPFKWAKFSAPGMFGRLVEMAVVDELIAGYRAGRQKKLSAGQVMVLSGIREMLAEVGRAEPEDGMDGVTSLSARAKGTEGLPDANDFVKEGDELYGRERYQEAIKAYTKALILEPGHAEAYYWRGWSYMNLGLYRLAISDCDRAIALAGDSAKYYHARGLAHYRRGNLTDASDEFERAFQDYNRAIEIDPSYRHAYLGRGSYYLYIGDRARGKPDLRRAIELIDEQGGDLDDRGYAFRLLGEYEQAVTDLGRYLESKPKDAFALYELGRSYSALGQDKEAVKAFRRSVLVGDPYWSRWAEEKLRKIRRKRRSGNK